MPWYLAPQGLGVLSHWPSLPVIEGSIGCQHVQRQRCRGGGWGRQEGGSAGCKARKAHEAAESDGMFQKSAWTAPLQARVLAGLLTPGLSTRLKRSSDLRMLRTKTLRMASSISTPPLLCALRMGATILLGTSSVWPYHAATTHTDTCCRRYTGRIVCDLWVNFSERSLITPPRCDSMIATACTSATAAFACERSCQPMLGVCVGPQCHQPCACATA